MKYAFLQFLCTILQLAFPCGSAVKNSPAVQETQEMWVRFLGWEDPLEEDMATHSSILAWRLSMDRGAWWTTLHCVAESQTGLERLSTTHPVVINQVMFAVSILQIFCSFTYY